MRWLLLLLVAVGCDPRLEDEELGEDLDGFDCEQVTFDGRFIDQAEPAPSVTVPGVALLERLETSDDLPVPIERGDVDTSPLPHCFPFPACLEALLRDKPLSGSTHAVLVFDGARLHSSVELQQPSGLSIVDLKRKLVFELARSDGFDFTFDDRSVTNCVGTSCQQLDFVDGTATLLTSYPRATSPAPTGETASRSP